jgi:hypothetical protein
VRPWADINSCFGDWNLLSAGWGRQIRSLVSCLINYVLLFGNLMFDDAISFHAALARGCEPLMTESKNRA